MTCPHCDLAATRLHGVFRVGCQGCTARKVARGPDFARVRRAGRLDGAYQQMLQAAELTHEQVKAAAAVDKAVAP
jgi:hypothetical protein